MITRAAIGAAVVLLSQFGHAASQVIKLRVVDELSRQPIPGAHAWVIAVPDTVATLSSDSDGFFSWPRKRGTYQIVISAPQYEPASRVVIIEDQTEFVPAFVLRRVVIPLDTLQVRSNASHAAAAPPIGMMGRTSFLLYGGELAALERAGATLPGVIQQIGPLKVRYLPVFRSRDYRIIRNYMCVESNRRMPSLSIDPPACDPVVLVVNGVAAGDAHDLGGSIRIGDIESIEYLPPVDAGLLYGLEASASGAVVIWTRGSGPHRSPARENKR